jgi:asparagine synthase (glutamine-hydrolysing)
MNHLSSFCERSEQNILKYMCGICGIISLSNQPLSSDILQKIGRMNDALAHRGPDDAGIWHNDLVALGHRRLSIIDLSAAGHQPMLSPDKQTVIAFNGEIYNYQDLKKQTPQYDYQGNSDTETLLAVYQKEGKSMLNKLNGMFAFAIWDESAKRVLIARDHLGIKPLYYFIHNDYVVFASEIRALLASDLVPRRLNKNALGEYLRYQTVYAPNTLVHGVSMLMPGHSIEIQNGKIKIESYWTFEEEAQISDTKSQSVTPFSDVKGQTLNYQKAVRETLRESVDRQMMSDVPFGAFLSGGIDSSVVVGLMREVTSGDIDTFTISFAEKKFDESPYARAISDRFKTKHHEIKLSPDDFLESLPDALNALDHPSGDAVNTFVVAKATKREGIKMALSGLGGDELFGGYPIFKQSERLQKLGFLNHIPQVVRHSAGQLLKKMTPSVQSQKIASVLSLDTISPTTAYPIFREVLNTEQRQTLLKNGYANPQNPLQHSIPISKYPNTQISQYPNIPLYSQVSISEMSGYMQNVLLRDSDQMSMAHALELRVPLLDVELVKLVLKMPDAVKKGVGSKPLLVAAVSDLLPPSLFDRPKMGFLLPFEGWMRNELRDFCTTYLTYLADRPEFHGIAIKELWQSFLAGEKGVSWSRLWTLVALAHWLKKNNLD